MSDSTATPTEAKTDHTDAHSDHGEHHGSLLAHVKPYLVVGVLLFVFTVITVGLSYVDFDKLFGGHGWNMKIGLAVATFKIFLVGAVFMHLKDEKGGIWKPLLFTFFFCLGLFALCLLHYIDPIHTTSHPLH